MDGEKLKNFLNRLWDDSVVPSLTDYIRIPNKSPAFDKDWEARGHMDKAVALLALEHRVPMLVIGAPRVGAPMRYEIVAEDFILPEQYEGRPDAVRSITQRFTAALERIIRTHPEQYFWLHRRWKHQPTKSRRRVA